MPPLADYFVRVRPDGSEFRPELRRVVSSGDRDADRAGRAQGQKFGRAWASTAIGPIRAIGAAAAGIFAGVQLVQFLKEADAEARESVKIGRLTAQVIKTTGGAAKVTAAQVDTLAESLSNKTAVDDEVVQGGANLLLTFTRVRNEVGKGNDIFNRATGLALDMSVALGTDLKGASLQLGKALNDPIKGVTALTRSGVSFTQAQKDQIEKLVGANKLLAAQKIILKEVATEFEGAARVAATPAERATVAWGNLKEELGQRTMPVVDRALNAWVDVGIPQIRTFGSFLEQEAAPKVIGFADVVVGAITGKGAQTGFAGSLSDGMTRAAEVVGEKIDAIIDLANQAKAELGPAVRDLAQVVVPITQDLSEFATEGIRIATDALRVAGPIIQDVTGFLVDHKDAVRSVIIPALGFVAAYRAVNTTLGGSRAIQSATIGFFDNLAARHQRASQSLTGLEGAGGRGAKALSGFGRVVGTVGAGLPILGLGLGAVALSLAHESQQAEAARQHMQDLFRAVEEGGKAGEEASQKLVTLGRALGDVDAGGDSPIGQLAVHFREAKDANDSWLNSLSVTERQQLSVTRAQNDYTAALDEYGPFSLQARSASDALQVAQSNLTNTQDRLAQASKSVTETITDQIDAIQTAASADLAHQQAVLSARSAIEGYNTTMRSGTATTNQQSQALVGAKQAIVGQAEAARTAAITALGPLATKTQQSAASNKALRDEYTKIKDQLAPGSPLRKFVQQLIADLDKASKNRTGTLTITTQIRDPSGAITGSRRGIGRLAVDAAADGGPVRPGLLLVGEEGPELLQLTGHGRVFTAGETRDLMSGRRRTGEMSRAAQGALAPPPAVTQNNYFAPGLDEEQLARRAARRLSEALGV